MYGGIGMEAVGGSGTWVEGAGVGSAFCAIGCVDGVESGTDCEEMGCNGLIGGISISGSNSTAAGVGKYGLACAFGGIALS